VVNHVSEGLTTVIAGDNPPLAGFTTRISGRRDGDVVVVGAGLAISQQERYAVRA
jgi:hypothetical protein